ncbi:MAG: PAS domain S-box protein, partial [Limnobacter sp.]|nr:PAS domain S-box protein [Limnobacter sp.]
MHSQSDHFNDFSPAGIASIDANGMIIQANKRFESLFGYDRDELTGQHLHILLPEQIRTRHEGLFASMSLSGQGRALNNAKPLQCISKTGQKLHILIGLRPVNLSGEQAEPNGWLVHVVDVTELAESTNRMKVLLEETLSRKETIKDMLDKRESMLRALSHELRTPLSICETLLNGEQPDSGQPTLTRHVLSNIHDRLTALVDVSRYWLGQGQDSVRSSGQAKDIVMRQIESVSQLAQVNPALFELITCDQVERPLVMDWVKLDAIVRRALAIALRVGVYSPGGIRVSLNLHPRGLHNARLQLTVEVDHHELHDHYFDESLHPIDIDQALIHEHTR